MNEVRREDTPPVGVKFHEYANIFPMLDGDALDRLKEDVRMHGVREPIVFLDGHILDGRNRYMVARDLGIEYPRIEYDGFDPLAFVISHNLHRRHLTESQRASVAAKLANMGKGKPISKSANLPIKENQVSNADAAALLNVSERSVRTARKVQDSAPKEIAEAVDDGRMSVSLAAKVADLPEEEQAKVVAAAPEETKAVARDAVKAANPKPRDGLSSLTREGLEDEVRALRRENGEVREKLAKSDQTVEDLRADIAELSESNHGAVISRLQAQLRAAKLKRDDAMSAQKRAEYKLGLAQGRAAP